MRMKEKHMIFSKVRQLRFAKEEKEGRRLTYEVMQKETGLSPGTLARLMKREPLDRVELSGGDHPTPKSDGLSLPIKSTVPLMYTENPTIW